MSFQPIVKFNQEVASWLFGLSRECWRSTTASSKELYCVCYLNMFIQGLNLMYAITMLTLEAPRLNRLMAGRNYLLMKIRKQTKPWPRLRTWFWVQKIKISTSGSKRFDGVRFEKSQRTIHYWWDSSRIKIHSNRINIQELEEPIDSEINCHLTLQNNPSTTIL